MCVRPRSLFPFVLSIFLFLRFFLLLLPYSTPPSRYSLSLLFLYSVVLITLRYYALLSLYLSRRYYLFIPRRSESGVSSRSFLFQKRLFHWYLLPSPPSPFFLSSLLLYFSFFPPRMQFHFNINYYTLSLLPLADIRCNRLYSCTTYRLSLSLSSFSLALSRRVSSRHFTLIALLKRDRA